VPEWRNLVTFAIDRFPPERVSEEPEKRPAPVRENPPQARVDSIGLDTNPIKDGISEIRA